MKKTFKLALIFGTLTALVGCGGEAISTPSSQDSNTTDSTSNNGGGNMPSITYGRKNPDYYTKGTPLIDDAHIVYINWDGFAQYYYDEAVKSAVDNYAPTLQSLMKEGVSFDYLENALPSITNPCQNMILTGATSVVTENVYRYWDKKSNIVIQQTRENKNKTLLDVVPEAGLQSVSVRHYLAEEHGYTTTNNDNKLYVLPDNTDPVVAARNKGEDHFSRMHQFSKMITMQSFNNGGKTMKLDKLPSFTVVYADDTDAVGHNEASHYGYPLATTEAGRMKNILALVKDMDAKLADMIAKAKAAGVYDKLTFFLTTDHGMQQFGYQGPGLKNGKGVLNDFIADITEFDPAFKAEKICPEGSSVCKNRLPDNKNIAIVSANLNLQLTWREDISEEKLQLFKTFLATNEYTKEYVGRVMTREELKESGYWLTGADMVISPKGTNMFTTHSNYTARGQHDSLEDSAHNIFGLIWGNGIKKNYVYKDTKAFNYDFGTTIAAALGVSIPNSNGLILDIFDR